MNRQPSRFAAFLALVLATSARFVAHVHRGPAYNVPVSPLRGLPLDGVHRHPGKGGTTRREQRAAQKRRNVARNRAHHRG